jgi:TrmH family RNA methyltransferase
MHLLGADISADPSSLAPHLHGGERVAEPLGLVLGSEGQGLSSKAKETCKAVSIPMSGEMESLNVGVAGGILMYILRPE